MNNRNFVRGVTIILKYLDLDGYDLAANHDEIYFGLVESVTNPEDVKELERLGWFEENESWKCFT